MLYYRLGEKLPSTSRRSTLPCLHHPSIAAPHRALDPARSGTHLQVVAIAFQPGGSEIDSAIPSNVSDSRSVTLLAASLGNIIAGLLAGEFRADALDEMPRLYLQIVLTTVGSGVLLALLAKPLKRLMSGAD